MLFQNENILAYLWQATFIIAAISILIFLSLIMLRYFEDKMLDKKTKRKKEIEKELLIHLANPLKNLKGILIKNKDDIEILAALAPLLLRTVKGKTYQSLLNAFRDVGLYDWVKTTLSCNNKKKCIAAISIASYWPPDKKINQKLKALLRNDHQIVRHSALEALANTRDVNLLNTIIREFERRYMFSSPLMCDVFQKFGAKISTKLAEVVKDKKTSMRLKIPELMALGKTGDVQSINEAAIPLCNDQNHELRAVAFLALANSGKSIPQELLKSGSGDADWRVRQYIADCAANTTPLPAEILTKLLQDENWIVGLNAAKALFSEGDAGIKLLRAISRNNTLAAQRARMMLLEGGIS